MIIQETSNFTNHKPNGIFPSADHFNSCYHGRWDMVIPVSDAMLNAYSTGAMMPFCDGALLAYSDKPSDKTVFQIHRGSRRAYTSLAQFLSTGQSLSAIRAIPQATMDAIPRGVDYTITVLGNSVLLLTGTITPTSATVTAGSTQQFHVVPNGGTPPYTHVWSSAATGGSDTVNPYFPTAGNYTVTDTITDSGSVSLGLRQTITVSANVQVTSTTSSGDLFGTSLYSDANLLAYYRFEGNSNDSKGSNNLTNSNGVTFGVAKFGNGADFGSGNTSKALSVNSSLGLANGSVARTISLWVKFYSLSGTQEFVSQWANSDHSGFLFYASGTSLVVGHSNFSVGEDDLTLSSSLTTGTWYHVVMTYDGSTMAGYLNGALIGSRASSRTNGNTINDVFTLGAAYGNNVGYAMYSSLVMDDVAVFSRALTATEISNIYSGGGGQPTTGNIAINVSGGPGGSFTCQLNGQNVTVPMSSTTYAAGSYTLNNCVPPSGYTYSVTPSFTQTLSGGGAVNYTVTLMSTSSSGELYSTSFYSDPNLVAYYRFESNANDSKGAYNGTANGGTTYVTGKFGQAASFNGTSGYVSTPGIPITNAFSWSLWLNQTGATSYPIPMYQGDSTSSYSEYLRVDSSGTLTFIQNPGPSLSASWTTSGHITANSFNHVVVTRDGTFSGVKIYINGVDAGATSSGGNTTTMLSGNYGFTFGSAYGGMSGTWYQGAIDDAAVFSRTLSAAEVASLYNGGGTTPSYTFTNTSGNQSVQAGNQVGYGLNLTPVSNFTYPVTVFVSGLPSSTSIISPSSLTFNIGPTSGASFTLTLQTTGGTPTGTYPLTLHAQGGGIDQYLYPTLTVTAPPPGPLSVSCSMNPNPINLGGGTSQIASATGGSGGYLYSFNGGSYQSSNSGGTFLPSNTGTWTYTVTVKDSSNTTASNSCSVTVNGVPPSNITDTWDTQPTHGVNFSGYVYGNAFTPASQIWFYGPGCTSGCQQNSAGVTIQSLTTIRVVNVNLAAGTFQVQVRTAYGSATSGNFTVN